MVTLSTPLLMATARLVPFSTLKSKKSFIFLGHLVSSFVKTHLPLILSRKLSKTREMHDDEIKTALKEAFHEIQLDLEESQMDVEFSGTTATVALHIVPENLFGFKASFQGTKTLRCMGRRFSLCDWKKRRKRIHRCKRRYDRSQTQRRSRT